MENCDGKTSVADIAKLLEGSFGNPVGDDLVWLAIDQLNEKNLLNEQNERIYGDGKLRLRISG